VEVYWLEQTRSSVPPGNEWLSESEAATVDGMRIPKRRADWLLGRWTAKLAISAYQCLPGPKRLAAIELRPAPSGAPVAFVTGRSAGLSLSLSHSHGVAFCTLMAGGAALGCDVEKVMPHSRAFVEDYFTIEEQNALAKVPSAHRERMLTLLWSAKESALKALQCGLRMDTRSVSVVAVSLEKKEGGTWNSLRVRHTGGTVFQGWWRTTGDLVWTVLANPSPDELIALYVKTGEV